MKLPPGAVVAAAPKVTTARVHLNYYVRAQPDLRSKRKICA